ncbi:MAG: transglutaminase family protein [Ruminococcus sp.]|nr:transglutaminase family protein [Ruminococcus sp.]MCM1382131.1 transglutaminase family protein [Muribaculaceae bacterium]MCM1479420.1 transglutaminase family protein [Muribaculaceae bacterium]
MKRFHFEYSAELTFSGDVTDHCFTLRCIPFSDGRQRVSEPKFKILPEGGSLWQSRDSFGSPLICGRLAEAHGYFSFFVSGEAEILNADFIVGGADPIFGYCSPLTEAGESILEFNEKIREKLNSNQNILEKALVISEEVFSRMKYRKGVTNVGTNAETALQKGEGVCQDYTHIFLSLCRLNGIRCRYVSGLAYESGETHAWAEINDGEKWYGIDPANNREITDRYIKICHGRDYSDCPIERGIYLGGKGSSQKIFSKVTLKGTY